MRTDAGVTASQRARARTMRGAPTEAELRLWRLLRDRRLSGFKFRRQVPVGPYIVDFLCVTAWLIVEADGSQHAENVHDETRDAWLARHGWRVLRFWNRDVLQSRESVLETIFAHATEASSGTPSSGASRHLLPEGEGAPFPARAERPLPPHRTPEPIAEADGDRIAPPSPLGRRWTREARPDEGRAAVEICLRPLR